MRGLDLVTRPGNGTLLYQVIISQTQPGHGHIACLTLLNNNTTQIVCESAGGSGEKQTREKR